jgi:hypothetical protein
VIPIRERLGALRYRLFGRCWAGGCGRLNVLHGPWRLARCWAENVPADIVLRETIADTIARVSMHARRA